MSDATRPSARAVKVWQAVISAAVLVTVTAWVLMLAFGTLHEYWPRIPAFGFFQALLLIGAFRLMFWRPKT